MEYIQSVPQDLIVRDNEGFTIDEYNYFETNLAIKSSYRITLLNQPILTGGAAKFIYNKTLDLNSFGVAFDFGLLIPFSGPTWSRIFPVNAQQNLSLGISILNMGPEIKILESGTSLPTRLNSGLNWLVYEDKYQKINSQFAGAWYFFSETIHQSLVPSFSLEYQAFKLLYFRASVYYGNNGAESRFGTGFSYFTEGKYGITIDYAIQPFSSYAITHQVNMSLKYFTGERMEKLAEKIRGKEEQSRDISKEIVEIINELLADYKLDHGEYPPKIELISPLMKKKYGTEKIPRPDEGFLTYDATIGKVEIKLQQSEATFNFAVTLRDGGTIYCDILEETENSILIFHKFGKMRLRKDQISKKVSKNLAILDEAILKTIQEYIEQFKNQKKTTPSSLLELEDFLKDYSAVSLPKPATGTLIYNPETGIIKLE